MAYYVSYSQTTHNEPTPGWYYLREDEDGNETIFGPYISKGEALDHESDGAYSEWLESKRNDRQEEDQDIRDSGRGHLLPPD